MVWSGADALENLMQNNRNRVEKELASMILDAMETFELEEVAICPLEALQVLNRTRIKNRFNPIATNIKKGLEIK